MKEGRKDICTCMYRQTAEVSIGIFMNRWLGDTYGRYLVLCGRRRERERERGRPNAYQREKYGMDGVYSSILFWSASTENPVSQSLTMHKHQYLHNTKNLATCLCFASLCPLASSGAVTSHIQCFIHTQVGYRETQDSTSLSFSRVPLMKPPPKSGNCFFFPFKDSRNKSPEELSYNVPGIQVFSWVSGNHDAQHGSRLAVIPEYLRLQLGSYDMGTLGKHYLNDVC